MLQVNEWQRFAIHVAQHSSSFFSIKKIEQVKQKKGMLLEFLSAQKKSKKK
jgi:hypothetical protein